MARETSVVTPERFAQGLTYANYIGQIKVNKARFEEFYDNFQVTSDETDALKALSQQPGGPPVAVSPQSGFNKSGSTRK